MLEGFQEFNLKSLAVVISFFIGLWPLSSRSALPPASLQTSLGVNVHTLSADFGEFDVMADMGIKFVRLDMTWASIETERGKYDWSRSLAKAAAMAARNIRPIFVLDYSNGLYAPMVKIKTLASRVMETPAAPATSDEIAAFTRFARAAAARFAQYDPIWEIWNEPEHSSFWPPKADANGYARLALSACSAIRQAVPTATVIGPASALPPQLDNPAPPFIVEVLKSPAIPCFDAISVHPYLTVPKIEQTAEDWMLLRNMIAASVPGAKPSAVVNSESGLSTRQSDVTQEMQAWYAVRMTLLNIASGVPVSVWYEWRDGNADPGDAEGGFGLRLVNAEPKLAYTALRNMTHLLSSTQFVCQSGIAGAGIRAMIFTAQNSGSTWAVMWNTNPDRAAVLTHVNLPLDGTLLDMYGAKLYTDGTPDGQAVSLGPAPVYAHVQSGFAPGTLCGPSGLRAVN